MAQKAAIRKQKQAERKLVVKIDQLEENLAEMRGIRACMADELGAAYKRQEIVGEANHSLAKRIVELEKANQMSEFARRITADGLIIERNELLNRAARLKMRIQGLGFDVPA